MLALCHRVSTGVIRCQSRLSFLTTIFRVLLDPKNYIKRTVLFCCVVDTVGHPVKPNVEAIDQALEDYLTEHEDDDTWYSFHEFIEDAYALKHISQLIKCKKKRQLPLFNVCLDDHHTTCIKYLAGWPKEQGVTLDDH